MQGYLRSMALIDRGSAHLPPLMPIGEIRTGSSFASVEPRLASVTGEP
jgi:hypothetical protein